jgi:hypothetical protein
MCAAVDDDATLCADRLGALLAILSGVSALSVAAEEHRWVLAAAESPKLPRPRLGELVAAAIVTTMSDARATAGWCRRSAIAAGRGVGTDAS